MEPIGQRLCTPSTPPATVNYGFGITSLAFDVGSQSTLDAVIPLYRVPTGINPLNFTSSVSVATADITAIAGQDYVPTNVLVTFGPGESLKEIHVTLLSDPNPAPLEQFGLKMLPALGSFIGVTQIFPVTIRQARVLEVYRENDHVLILIQTGNRQHYAVEASENLKDWEVVPGAENINGTGSPVSVPDPASPCCESRFYRLRLLP